MTTDDVTERDGGASAACFSINYYWWGFEIVMDEDLTQKIITGSEAVGALTGLLAAALAFIPGIGPVLTTVAGLFAAAFVVKALQIKFVDNGNGVYWPVTIPQIALVIATPVAGSLAFLHPFANASHTYPQSGENEKHWSFWSAVGQYVEGSGGPVSAVIASNITHLFTTKNDGTIIMAARAKGKWPNVWPPVSTTAKSVAGAPVTAVTFLGEELQLFMAGTDGTIWTIRRREGKWDTAWSAIKRPPKSGGSNVVTTPGAPITAVYRDSEHLDLFVSGTDGAIWTIGQEKGTWGASWTNPVAGTRYAVYSTPGAPISAVYHTTGQLDVFVAGKRWNGVDNT
jgi:hypothetical protein